MIAISLFIVIIIAGMGALLNANLVHNKSQDMRSIMDNLSFILEDMSRNLRTGYNFRCLVGNDKLTEITEPRSCEQGWGIAFEFSTGDDQNPNDQWVYYIDNTGKIFKATEAPYTDPAEDPESGFIQLTPDEVVIDEVSSFSVLGAEGIENDEQQPLVGIRLSGTVNYKEVETPFSIQTSISQRLIDI